MPHILSQRCTVLYIDYKVREGLEKCLQQSIYYALIPRLSPRVNASDGKLGGAWE